MATDDDLEWLIEKLLRSSDGPSKTLCRRIVAVGPPIVPALLEIVTERELWNVDSPGAGRHPVHATRLLAKIPSAAAVEPLLEVLAELDSMDVLFTEVIHALTAIGAPVVEPILTRLPALEDGLTRAAMIEVLGGCGVRSEPIFELLVAELERDPMAATMSLADFGDPRAIPRLEAVFDREPLEEAGDLGSNMLLIEVADAIRALGGELDDTRRAKLDAAVAARSMSRAHALALLARAATGPSALDAEDETDEDL